MSSGLASPNRATGDADRLAPGFRAILAARRMAGRPDLAAARADPAAARQAQKRFVGLFGMPAATTARVRPAGSAQGVDIVDIVPETTPAAGTVVYVHGGGLVFHDVETFLPVLSHLAADSGCRVLALDYPKAPETPPHAILEALGTAIEAAARRFAGPGPLTLAGDSIGGLAVLHAAWHRLADIRPGLVLAYPVLDLSRDRHFPSRDRYATGHLLDADFMAWFRDLARDGIVDDFDPLSFGTADFERLGPIAVLSAACDILCDEAQAFERRAREAGAAVERQVLHRLPHDFMLFAGRVDEAADGLKILGAKLTRNQ